MNTCYDLPENPTKLEFEAVEEGPTEDEDGTFAAEVEVDRDRLMDLGSPRKYEEALKYEGPLIEFSMMSKQKSKRPKAHNSRTGSLSFNERQLKRQAKKYEFPSTINETRTTQGQTTSVVTTPKADWGNLRNGKRSPFDFGCCCCPCCCSVRQRTSTRTCRSTPLSSCLAAASFVSGEGGFGRGLHSEMIGDGRDKRVERETTTVTIWDFPPQKNRSKTNGKATLESFYRGSNFSSDAGASA